MSLMELFFVESFLSSNEKSVSNTMPLYNIQVIIYYHFDDEPSCNSDGKLN